MIAYLTPVSAFLSAGLGVLAAASANDQARPGDWYLVQSANPHGGPDAISMIHNADTSRSDLDLAGLMLRCSEKGVDVAIVVVTPVPPQARPAVTIRANDQEWRFDASIVSPGAELLLPGEATNLTRSSWQSAGELAVKVSWLEHSFGGVIPIDGLTQALAILIPKCPAH
jgi:hypothetical protein